MDVDETKRRRGRLEHGIEFSSRRALVRDDHTLYQWSQISGCALMNLAADHPHEIVRLGKCRPPQAGPSEAACPRSVQYAGAGFRQSSAGSFLPAAPRGSTAPAARVATFAFDSVGHARQQKELASATTFAPVRPMTSLALVPRDRAPNSMSVCVLRITGQKAAVPSGLSRNLWRRE